MSDQTYLGNGSHKPEPVYDGDDYEDMSISRIRVPGGWLYIVYDPEADQHTTTFVPMPVVVKHKV